MGVWPPWSQSLPEPNGIVELGLKVVGSLWWKGAVGAVVVEEAGVGVEVEEVVDDVDVGWAGCGSEDDLHNEEPSNATVGAAVAVGVELDGAGASLNCSEGKFAQFLVDGGEMVEEEVVAVVGRWCNHACLGFWAATIVASHVALGVVEHPNVEVGGVGAEVRW